jgi:hypothetical protein
MVGQRTLNPFILVRIQARQLLWDDLSQWSLILENEVN